MTNPNALPFDAATWPEKQRLGWRFAVQYGPAEPVTECHYVGQSKRNRPVWQNDSNVPSLYTSDDPTWPICKMLPPPRVLTFSLGLFKRDGSAWVGFTTTESDRFLLRDLTPAERAEGRVALDD